MTATDVDAPRLDPYFATRAATIAGLAFEDLSDPSALTRFQAYLADDDTWALPGDVVVEEHRVPGSEPITVRTYAPEGAVGTPLVWMHGGGFAFGDLDALEAHMVSAEVAHRARTVVVSVDYRLASEKVRFPAPVDDVIDAWRWTAERYGRAPALGGASAGAALAVSAALRLRHTGGEAAAALLLAYPFLHFPNPAPDAAVLEALAVFPPLLRLDAAMVERLVAGYVGRISDVPRDAMPGSAPLVGLPPVHLVVSEIDDLRSSADLFARQLAESGVTVTAYLAKGMPHGHLNRVPAVPGVSETLDFLAAALRGGVTPTPQSTESGEHA